MNLLVAPDSFKGTLSAPQAASIMTRAFRQILPIESVVQMPLGDGGEGTADCLIAAGGKPVVCSTVDGYGNPVAVQYATLNSTAVIDSASVVPMYAARREPETASTFGLGAVVQDAVQRGCRTIMLALGGTGSNDAGCGLAAALGVRFLDENGTAFLPCGKTLHCVAAFDCSEAHRALAGVSLFGLCDVTNPFFGPNGAAYLYAPQKGASPETVCLLDAGMQSLAGVIAKGTGFDVQAFSGAGAAGGLGGGIAAFLNGTLTSGIQAVLRLLHFAEAAEKADLILTGEGCTDEQTLMGKAISGVLASAGRTPVIVLSGTAKHVSESLSEHGASAVCAVNRVPADFQAVAAAAAETLFDEACNTARLIALGMRLPHDSAQTGI